MVVTFSGTVTFKNARHSVEVAEVVPLDRLLLETDAPYLSPVPMRGKMNHSGNLHYTAETVARELGLEYDEFVKISTENAKRLFKL